VQVDDLHKHHVDEITIPSKMGKEPLRRVDEVFDCPPPPPPPPPPLLVLSGHAASLTPY